MTAAPTFKIGGDLEVGRIGFGALRIVGPSFWGEPDDPAAAHAVLRRAVELGVTLIDTADSYGPETSERLIREALSPYPPGLTIATKGGYVRPDAASWIELGRPEYLIHAAKLSARRLGLDTIPLWQLHRVDPKVPRDEQFDAIKRLRDEGVIRHAGLSEVDVETIEAARVWFPVATVQNNYSVANRRHEAVLNHCEAKGIGFLAFFPLGAGKLAIDASPLKQAAARRGVTPAQVALAWLIKRSPVIMPIPGTASLGHLAENVAAARVELSDEEFAQIDVM